MEDKIRSATFTHMTRPLFKDYGQGGILEYLMKSRVGSEGSSAQGTSGGRKEHPFDMSAVVSFKNHNIHHSTCIETKRDATVGLGFVSDKPGKILDDFCDVSFLSVLSDTIEDYWQTGNSYIEVRRAAPYDAAPVIGLHHIASPLVYKNVEVDSDTGTYDFHWEVVGSEGTTEQRFAQFGDLEDFIERKEYSSSEAQYVSEIIAIPRPTSLHRWYGWPDWISAVSNIELNQMLIQHEFDFFLNRGVPEFLLFIMGSSIDTKTCEAISDSLKANIGFGNSYKSGAFNIQNPNAKVQIEKLGLGDRQQGIFAEYTDALAQAIVSAHRVPPLLAGIQIPGKLGATNELPNALMAFQVLIIGQAQKRIQNILAGTLGTVVGLSEPDFEFNKITEEINIGEMDTVSRMREPATGDRDPAEGLKD